MTDPDGVATVALEYQVVAPGSYIPSRLPHPIVRRRIPAALTALETPLTPNPAHSDPLNWTTLPMRDDGTGGDDNPEDGIFSVEIPSQSHRSLLGKAALQYRLRSIRTHSLRLKLFEGHEVGHHISKLLLGQQYSHRRHW